MTDLPAPAPISYRFERADMGRLAEAIHRRSWTRRILYLVSVLIIVLVIPTLVVGSWPTASEWAIVLGEPGVFLPFSVAILAALFGHYLSVLVYVARFRSFAMADREVRLTFGPDSLDADVVGKARTSLPWTALVDRIEWPDRTFPKIGRYEALTVPRRAFADEPAYEAALAFLRTKVPHGSS